MTKKDIAKVVVYGLKDGNITIGRCNEIDQNKREINLEDACQFEKNKNNKTEIKTLYNSLRERKNISIKIDDIKNGYIL